jgi:hypothetical protein
MKDNILNTLKNKFNPNSNKPIDLTLEERDKILDLLDDFCKQLGIYNEKTDTSDDIHLN